MFVIAFVSYRHRVEDADVVVEVVVGTGDDVALVAVYLNIIGFVVFVFESHVDDDQAIVVFVGIAVVAVVVLV